MILPISSSPNSVFLLTPVMGGCHKLFKFEAKVHFVCPLDKVAKLLFKGIGQKYAKKMARQA
jgi:hypothetical protein